MNEAEKKAHYMILVEHLYDGGKVESKRDGIPLAFPLQKVAFSWMAEHPYDYTIIESPMVYLIEDINNPKEQYALTTYELRGVTIEAHLKENTCKLIGSIPIEDLNNG